MLKNHRSNVLLLTAALLIGASILATTRSHVSAAPTPTKVGIVNVQEAILGTEEGKQQNAALEKRFGPKQAELKQAGAEIADLEKRISTMPAADRKAATTQLNAKQKKLQRDFTDAQQEFQQAEQQAFSAIGAKMLTVLKDFSQKNDYAVILDGSGPGSPVLYAQDGADITKQLVAAYNAQAALPSAPAPQNPAAQQPTPKK